MTYIPLFLDTVHTGSVLVIGGGEIAAAKTEALASTGAQVDVIAKKLSDEIIALCDKHAFSYDTKEYDASDLQGRRIVVAATDSDDTNQSIANECRKQGILVNVVDNPPLCDFIFPALIRRGALQIAVSTSGVSPVLARLIKQTIETVIPTKFEKVINFLEEKKSITREHLTKIQPRRLFYENIIRGRVAEDVMEDNTVRANLGFADALSRYPNTNNAALYLVGTGPGNPDLMTIKAVRILSQADVILYDRLIPPTVMDLYARKDAQKIAVGKTRCHHHKKQEDIDTLIERHLSTGKIVVRLKGGDPGIYAHGAEEIAVARRVGASYHIIPGVSAANGCAAYSGIPLTERGGALSVRFLTLYRDQLENEEFWHGLSFAKDETLVLYMSSNNYPLLCNKLLEHGFDSDTPFLIIEQGTTDYHKDYPGTISTFSDLYEGKKFASPCLMVLGDVVKWREQHNWKEEPIKHGEYFTPLPPKEDEKEAA